MRIVLALLPYLVRGTRWRPVVGGAVAGSVFAAGVTLTPITDDAHGLTAVLRVTALFIAVGAAFLFDDASELSAAVTPLPRRLRATLRLAVATPVLAAAWVTALLVLRADAGDQRWSAVPVADLSVEAATLIAVAVGVAAVGVRRAPHDGGGVRAAPVTIGLTVVAHAVPDRYSWLPGPGDPRWVAVHRWWGVLLVAAVMVALWGSGDLARAGAGRWRRSPNDR